MGKIYRTKLAPVIILNTRKKAASRPLFPKPCGQLFGLCPTSFLFNLRHGRLGGCALTPTQVFLSVIKVIGKLDRNCSWEISWSLECPYGCQEQLLFWCLLQKMSFNPSKYHMSSISGIRALEDRKGSWEESWCSWRPCGCPIRKCLLTHQYSTCLPSLELDPCDDRMGSRQESAF